MDKEPKKKKLPLKERLRMIFNGVSRKDLAAVFAETIKDLRKPKEIGIFVVATIVPGGWIGYAGYRIAKHQFNKNAANDDNPPEAKAKKPRPPKPG